MSRISESVDATVSAGPGEKKGYTEKVVELPIKSATDQAIAQRYLNATGMGPLGGFQDIPKGVQNYLPIQNPIDALGATKEFGQAAANRGFVTDQTFDNVQTIVLGHNSGLTYLIQGLMASFLAIGSGIVALIGLVSRRRRSRVLAAQRV